MQPLMEATAYFWVCLNWPDARPWARYSAPGPWSRMLVAAAAIGFTLASRQQENLGTLVVRADQATPDRAVDRKNHLNSLCWMKQGGDGGAAQVFGNGLVMVRAPLGSHQGVQADVDKLASLPTEARQHAGCSLCLGDSGFEHHY